MIIHGCHKLDNGNTNPERNKTAMGSWDYWRSRRQHFVTPEDEMSPYRLGLVSHAQATAELWMNERALPKKTLAVTVYASILWLQVMQLSSGESRESSLPHHFSSQNYAKVVFCTLASNLWEILLGCSGHSNPGQSFNATFWVHIFCGTSDMIGRLPAPLHELQVFVQRPVMIQHVRVTVLRFWCIASCFITTCLSSSLQRSGSPARFHAGAFLVQPKVCATQSQPPCGISPWPDILSKHQGPMKEPDSDAFGVKTRNHTGVWRPTELVLQRFKLYAKCLRHKCTCSSTMANGQWVCAFSSFSRHASGWARDKTRHSNDHHMPLHLQW